MEAVTMNVHAVLPAKGTAPNMHLYVAMGVGQGKAQSALPKFCSPSAALFSSVSWKWKSSSHDSLVLISHIKGVSP